MSRGGEENKNWWHVLLARPVAYHPALARVAGSVAGGGFLSQALYWQGKIPPHRPPGCPGPGWFWKSCRDWEEETALGRKQQETARAKLVQLGILKEKRCGVPARMFFQVNMEKLEELLKKQSVRKTTTKKEKKEPPPRKMEGSAAEEIEEYLRLGLLFGAAGGPPRDPEAWVSSVGDRLRRQGKLNERDKGQLIYMAKKEREGGVDGKNQPNSNQGSDPRQSGGGGMFSAGLDLIKAAAGGGAGGGEQEDEESRLRGAKLAN